MTVRLTAEVTQSATSSPSTQTLTSVTGSLVIFNAQPLSELDQILSAGNMTSTSSRSEAVSGPRICPGVYSKRLKIR